MVQPEELPVGRGVFAALVIPFGEPANRAHEDAGKTFEWGDVRLPRRQIDVLDTHDGELVGYASSFTLTRAGVWCSLKLGRRGEQILHRGRGISAEIVDGEITHVALAGAGPVAFASAQVTYP